MEIVSANSNFDFKSATLADPQPLTGQAGFYFTQLSVGEENKALCLQLPECVTKQGVVAIKNAKYMDLMFERDNHTDLMRWIEKMEYTCQDIIDSKKELWFQSELTRDDIETMMTQIARLYQSGKYGLIRVFIDVTKAGQKCIAYDENEKGYDLDSLEANKPIIPLVMIEGVKFSSRSFEISLKLVQVMVLGKHENKSSCLIKRPEQKQPTILDKPTLPTTPIRPKPSVNNAIVTTSHEIVKPVTESIQPKVKPPAEILTKKTTIQTPTKSSNMLSVGEKPLKPVLKNTVALNRVPVSAPVVSVPVPTPPPKSTSLQKNEMEEIDIKYEDLSDSISLKKPNEVYYEIYKNAREKAKLCRTKAIEAYLEAKEIKTKYMLHDLDDSDDDVLDDENYDEDFE